MDKNGKGGGGLILGYQRGLLQVFRLFITIDYYLGAKFSLWGSFKCNHELVMCREQNNWK